MSRVFDENIKVLKKIFPPLAETLLKNKTVSHNEYCVTASDTGAATLTVNGHFVHSKRDPEREGRRIAETVLNTCDNEAGAIVVLGFGLGYAALAAAEIEGESAFIIAEKDLELFRLTLQTIDLTKFLSSSKIIFILGGGASGINAALSVFKKIKSVIRNAALYDLEKEWFYEIEKYINTWKTKNDVNAATLNRFGKRWVQNIYSNLYALRDLPGINMLTGRFDFPVLLIAAGPSLDEIAGHLAELQKRFLIVAVDTALRFCVRLGVMPDFVVSCDGQYWNYRHLDCASNFKSCLVSESSVYPSLLRSNAAGEKKFAKIFLSGSLYPAGRFIESRVDDKGRLGAGGSVATSALDFALALISQCQNQRLYAAGLDLGFIDGKTHYKGALFEESAINGANRFLPAETQSFKVLHSGFSFYAHAADGEKILTDKRLSLYAAWFENKIKAVNANGRCDVFSLSKKGLLIKNLKTAEIEDALALPTIREKISERLKEVFLEIDNKWNCKTEFEKRNIDFNNAVSLLSSELKKILGFTLARDKSGIRGITGDNSVLNSSPAKDTALFLLPQNDFENKDLIEILEFNIKFLERCAAKSV